MLFNLTMEREMKKLILLSFVMFFSLTILASEESKEKPTQHLKISNVTSMNDAKAIFLRKTLEIMDKKNISLKEASEIHVITYTLEKSVAYFAENLRGEKQSLAKQMAVVVENIHISSESNRLEKLKKHLDEYSELADKFIFCF